MPLARMICLSQTRFPVGHANDKTMFRGIHDELSHHYSERHITGVLMFDWDHFLQVVEGDRVRLTEAFLAMARDPRQQNIVLLDFSLVDERLFSRWQMVLRDDSPETMALIIRHGSTSHWKPELLSPESALKLVAGMVRLREHHADQPLRAAQPVHHAA